MKKYTPFKRLDRYVFPHARYKTVEDMQKDIREHGKCEDYVAVDNVLYTMEEYDNDGQYIDYHNTRTGNTIKVSTENRYKLGYKDAVVDMYENYGISRNDIVFAD
jgi:hypothetical protein